MREDVVENHCSMSSPITRTTNWQTDEPFGLHTVPSQSSHLIAIVAQAKCRLPLAQARTLRPADGAA